MGRENTRAIPSWTTRLALGLAAALVVTGAAGGSAAQAVVGGRRAASAPAEAPPQGGGAPLKGSVGIPVAERLLASGDAEARLRGIVRLGAIGTPEAIDALLEALDQGSPAGRDPQARLEAVRALAPHATREPVRQLLTRELTDAAGASGRGPASPLGEIVRGTAALALAKTGDKRALAVLMNAIVQGGAPGDAAARALRAYPPASLQLLLGSRKRLAPPVIAFLGELGDLRAIERLRPLLETGDVPSQLAAALALAKLGDEAALPRARGWLRKPEPRLLRTAAEVLVYLGAPEAPDAIAALLKSASTRLDGLRLAELAPAPRLAAKLAQALQELPQDARPRAVAAIGRAGGPDAARQLRALVERAPERSDGAAGLADDRPELAAAAAHALSMMPGPDAKAALEAIVVGPRAAKDRALYRLGVRAGVVRALGLRDGPDGLEAALRALRASKDPSDRAVGAFGAAALGLEDAGDLVRGCGPASCDGAVVHAAARGALARGPDALAPFAAALERLAAAEGAPEPAAVAAGVALLADPTGGALPTSRLAAWAEGGGPLSPLAARALASRDDDVVRGRIKRLLEGSDPVVRAHVALGLGRDPEADAVSLLAAAYRFEEDAAVRRAIVRGLSRRPEVQRKRALRAARDLDPDEGVRSLARAALDGRVLDPSSWALATGVAWIRIVPNDASAAPRAYGRAGRLVRPDGLAVPVVADPDGVILVPGMPPGPASITLAPAPPPGDAGAR